MRRGSLCRYSKIHLRDRESHDDRPVQRQGSVRQARGRAYTISGAPDAAALNGSYRAEVAPVEHLSQPFQSGGSGPFNNVSISVSESHGDVRVIKVDPDDYC